LKSLIWFFREKVRSHDFKSLGVKEQKDGIFSVYCGEKCANEQFIDTNGPCGYGEHDHALYQWGIGGDYNNDSGSLHNTVIFDAKDGWQVTPEVQARWDEQDKLGQAQRDLFAQQLQQRLTGMGYDITVWVHGTGAERGHELNLDSEMFKDTATRVQFINGVLPEWKKDLCKVGFRVVAQCWLPFWVGLRFGVGSKNVGGHDGYPFRVKLIRFLPSSTYPSSMTFGIM
jgi:hypothetical protein